MFIGRTDLKLKSNTLATWCKELTNLRRPYAGKDWGQEEKGMTGWDGWMASLTQWMWVWANSGTWQRTGKPGVLQSMGLQSWTQLSNWTELHWTSHIRSPVEAEALPGSLFLILMIWLMLNYLLEFIYNSNSNINFVQKDWFLSYHLSILKLHVHVYSYESLGLQGDPTSPFWRRSALGFIWKEWC